MSQVHVVLRFMACVAFCCSASLASGDLKCFAEQQTEVETIFDKTGGHPITAISPKD